MTYSLPNRTKAAAMIRDSESVRRRTQITQPLGLGSRPDCAPPVSRLLEWSGRLKEAVDAWRAIIAWHEKGGEALHATWPKQEVERLRKVEH